KKLRRDALAAAERRETAAGRRVRTRLVRVVRQGAGSAVPGPDQGTPELARRRETGLDLHPAAARTVAEPARRLRPQAGRTGHQAGPIPPAFAAEGRKEKVPGLGGPPGKAPALRSDGKHRQ